jgi:hypothetical protein
LKKNAIPRVQLVAMDRLEVKWFAYLSCYIWLFTIGVGEDASGNKVISPRSPNFIRESERWSCELSRWANLD